MSFAGLCLSSRSSAKIHVRCEFWRRLVSACVSRRKGFRAACACLARRFGKPKNGADALDRHMVVHACGLSLWEQSTDFVCEPSQPASRSPIGKMNSVKSSNPGGGSGIRTRDTVSGIHTFQACAFNHSATPPAAEPGARAHERAPGAARAARCRAVSRVRRRAQGARGRGLRKPPGPRASPLRVKVEADGLDIRPLKGLHHVLV